MSRQHDQEWHAQRRADSVDAVWILAYAAGFATFIACWNALVEWVFGMFP